MVHLDLVVFMIDSSTNSSSDSEEIKHPAPSMG